VPAFPVRVLIALSPGARRSGTDHCLKRVFLALFRYDGFLDTAAWRYRDPEAIIIMQLSAGI
jgi:hypothetical protein